MHQVGERISGRYRLDALVGAGGMGEVWRATDETLGRVVAIKLMAPALRADPAFLNRFRAEARTLAHIDHPGVVTVHDIHDDADGAYLVMEYVDGEPLSELLRRAGRLPVAQAMELVAAVADALQAVHERGIVHRDVKPANVLVRPSGAVVVTDFGIAFTAAATRLTATGAVLGTPAYLAPEQALGQPATARTDVYALGLLAYECLTGHGPFERDHPFAAAMARVHEPPATLPGGIPPVVSAIVERALAVDPADRWPSAAELADACRRALAAGAAAPGPTLRPAQPPGTPTARPNRRPYLVAGGVAGALVLLAAAAFAVADAVTDGGQPGSEPSPSSSPAASGEPAAAACAWRPLDPSTNPALQEVEPPPPMETLPAGPATMTISTNRGDIEVRLDAVAAPCAFASFAHLGDLGFFDDTTCHRLTTEGIFVLQCGDPTGTGQGGPTYQFPDENLPAGLHPPYPAGTVAMANSGPDSNGSQFFIVYQDGAISPDYSVVGTVTRGMEIVERVAEAGHDGALDSTAGGGYPRRELVIETLRVTLPR
jgi:serine/threonine protein kinase/cyclophilin family peptidyl-prolyl cis-trans isomerase